MVITQPPDKSHFILPDLGEDHGGVIVELKCVEKIMPIHEAQLLTYLRLAQKTVGLLINFNVAMLRNGIVRKVLSSPSFVSASSASLR